MKKHFSPRHFKRNIVLTCLLALLCIGATELIACSYFAPDVYEQIVAPVRYAAAVTVDACRAGFEHTVQFCQGVGQKTSQFMAQTMDQAAQFWEDLTTPKETPPPPPADESEPVESADPGPAPFLTNPPHTEVVEIDGNTVLLGGTIDVTYFCQTDEAWAEQPYGSDTIGPYGCGPTVMAMVVASMTDTDTDPTTMAAWAVQHGYWARRSGSYHSIIMGTAQSFGLDAETFPSRDPSELCAALREGKVLVALMGRGHFTGGGHFILLRGLTLDGQILVADPNSLENSLQTWDPQLILDELSSARTHGAPLWAISYPTTY